MKNKKIGIVTARGHTKRIQPYIVASDETGYLIKQNTILKK